MVISPPRELGWRARSVVRFNRLDQNGPAGTDGVNFFDIIDAGDASSNSPGVF
jgi:hypothetical protein